jgi:transposase InsO family protein
MFAHEDKHRIKRMCNALQVGRSGYYSWRKSRSSQREQANQELLAQIKEVHQASRQTYGSPRVHKALKRMGIVCGRNRVARLMRIHQIVGRKPRRRYPATTRRQPGALAAPNLLNQDFSADGPNQKWVTDITYIDTAEGWLYLATVLDLFSRMVVGWAMADHMETSLVEDALCMALVRRHPAPGWIHHSDQGSQYTSEIYQQHLTDHHCQVSMSGVGNCYDNATMESFIATLKKECVTHQFVTREQARRAIFEYIEVWYNRCRLHSSLDYLSPLEFEQSQDIKCVQ